VFSERKKSPLKSSLKAIEPGALSGDNFSIMRVSLIDRIFSVIGASKKEDRKEPRRKDELPVEIEFLPEDSQTGHKNVFYAQIKDISAGGVKIWTSVYIPLGTSIRLRITLTKLGESIGPIGKVVWGNRVENSDMYEMGIEFEKIPPDILCTLLEYIYRDWD